MRATSGSFETEFVCIPRPLERSTSANGGPLRYRVRCRSKLLESRRITPLRSYFAGGRRALLDGLEQFRNYPCGTPIANCSRSSRKLLPLQHLRDKLQLFPERHRWPRLRIERPGMPGANQFAALNQALGQRTSPVRAFAVQGPDHPIDVGNTQRSRTGTELPGLSGLGQVTLDADLHQ